VVGWRQRLISVIFSSFLDGFTLFGVTSKTGYSNETLPSVLQAEVASLPPNPPYVSCLRSQGEKDGNLKDGLITFY